MKRIALGLLAALAFASGPSYADPAGAGVNPGTAGTQSEMAGCVYRSGSISPASGQQMGLGCDSAGALKVVNSGSPSGTQDVNLTGINGVAPVTGSGTATAALRVELPTDGTGKVGLNAGSAVIGHVITDTTSTTAVTQATAANLNATVVGTGTFQVQCSSGCSGSGGTASTFGAAFPATGTAVGFIDSTGTNMAGGNLDASGYLKVNVAAGSSGNAAASATGAAVPASADYGGLNVGGTLRGQTAVNPAGSVYAAQTDLTSVNGVTASTGSGAVGTGSARVAVGTDTATIAGSAPGTAGSASANVLTVQGVASMTPVQVSQATASNLNAAVVGTGSAGTAATGVVTVQGIASMTPLLVTPAANSAVNLAQVGGTTVVNGGLAGSQSVGGTVATNVAITDNPINNGGQAVSSENTAVTATRKVQFVADLVGKQIVLPYANPENFVSGTTAAMTGTTSTSLLAAPASGLRNYVTQISCVNSHATVGTFVTVQDGSGGTALMTLAAGSVFGGSSYTLPTPLRQPTTATALFVANVTTGANVICSATGYKGL